MADEYFVGLRATGDVADNELEGAWRRGIMRLFPNGDTPLTALTNLMGSSRVSDPYFHWWDKTLTTQKAVVAAGQTYDDPSLSTSYGDDGNDGDTVYFKIADVNQTKMFKVGHTVLMRKASDYNLDTVGACTLVVQNGTNSVLGVRLLEDDDNSSANKLSAVDTLLIIGNANAMGGTRPDAIAQSPTERTNRVQIFRDSLDMSRTLMLTKGRSSTNFYPEAKRDALEQHALGMEKSFIWGIQHTGTGSNNKPLYYTSGLLESIKADGTVQDYVTDSDVKFSGKSWVQKGTDWLDEHFEEMFRFGSDERLAFCGSGALLGIQRLVRELGVYNLTPYTTSFGLKVMEWVTPFGVIHLKRHPLFSYEATNRNAMVLFEPKNIKYRYVTDTMFKPDILWNKGGATGKDGKEEEYLTEAGLEYHFPITGGYLNGVGLDNVA